MTAFEALAQILRSRKEAQIVIDELKAKGFVIVDREQFKSALRAWIDSAAADAPEAPCNV